MTALPKRAIEVVDFTDFHDRLSHDLYVALIDTINQSDVSWGTNADTLITPAVCVDFLAQTLEDFLDGRDEANRLEWVETIDEARALIREVGELPDTVFIALGS